MTHRPDRERIIKEYEWAIARIEDYGSTTMTSRLFFADVAKLLKEHGAVEPVLDKQTGRLWLCGNCGSYVGFEDNDPHDPNEYDKYCRECGRPVLWEGR